MGLQLKDNHIWCQSLRLAASFVNSHPRIKRMGLSLVSGASRTSGSSVAETSLHRCSNPG